MTNAIDGPGRITFAEEETRGARIKVVLPRPEQGRDEAKGDHAENPRKGPLRCVVRPKRRVDDQPVRDRRGEDDHHGRKPAPDFSCAGVGAG